MSSGLNELLEDLQAQLSELQESRRTYEAELKKSGKSADVTLTRMLGLEFQLTKSIERVSTTIAKSTPVGEPALVPDGFGAFDELLKSPEFLKEFEELLMKYIKLETEMPPIEEV